MPFLFTNYSHADLQHCAAAFVQDFEHAPQDITTPDIMRWFASTAPPSVRVYGHHIGQRRNGEYMLDQCHTTFPFPQDGEKWPGRWQRALDGKLRFELALESEWGKEGSHGINCARVLDDAWKVAMVRATAKVVIFASTRSTRALDLFECMRKLRRASDDDAPWLCIDIPWEQKRVTPRKIHYKVI